VPSLPRIWSQETRGLVSNPNLVSKSRSCATCDFLGPPSYKSIYTGRRVRGGPLRPVLRVLLSSVERRVSATPWRLYYTPLSNLQGTTCRGRSLQRERERKKERERERERALVGNLCNEGSMVSPAHGNFLDLRGTTPWKNLLPCR